MATFYVPTGIKERVINFIYFRVFRTGMFIQDLGSGFFSITGSNKKKEGKK
jgi:hypothetical protein